MYIHICSYIYIHIYIYIYIYSYMSMKSIYPIQCIAHACAHLYVCMYVMCICMYVCMNAYIYVYIYIYSPENRSPEIAKAREYGSPYLSQTCMCMSICMYVYVHMCVYLHVHECVKRVYVCIHVCLYVCLCVSFMNECTYLSMYYICVCVCECVCVYVREHFCLNALSCFHTDIHAEIGSVSEFVCMRSYLCTYACMCARMHACVHKLHIISLCKWIFKCLFIQMRIWPFIFKRLWGCIYIYIYIYIYSQGAMHVFKARITNTREQK